jgi:hypothetical protein
MTHRAAREPLDLVFLHQLFAKGELIRGRLPLHVENLVSWPDESLRIAVTLETPLHVERVLAPHERHLVHAAMARRTTDALVNVNAVIEISEPGQIVHPRPFQ